MNTKSEIISKEITYILRVLKKLWILIIIPVILTISSYIMNNIEFESLDTAMKFQFVFNIHYDITTAILKYYWIILSGILMLFYCQLRIGTKTRKLTVLLIVGGGLAMLVIFVLFEVLVLRDDYFIRNDFEKWLKIFFVPVGFIYSIFLCPFFMLKIKHLIKFNVKFFKNYFSLIIILVVCNIIIGKTVPILCEIPFVKFLKNYTIDNIMGNITVFTPCITVIVYKNRKRINLQILNLLKKSTNPAASTKLDP